MDIIDILMAKMLSGGSGGGGMSEAFKQALLNCFANVAWKDTDGQDYYDALNLALNPPANLVSISAVFNQGSAAIYSTDTLETLKQYLVVTARYDNGNAQIVTNYTLSGTLVVGTSTITASFGGKTDTFNVVVSNGVPGYTFYDYLQYTAEAVTSVGATRAFTTRNYDVFDCNIKQKVKPLNSITRDLNSVGSRNGSSSTEQYTIAYKKSTSSFFANIRGVASSEIPAALDTVHTVEVSSIGQSPTVLTVDGSSAQIEWTEGQSMSRGFTLLSSGYGSLPLFANMQVGTLEIYDSNNNLIGKYEPAVRNSDNQIGIYDTVENIFYTCSTASFGTIGHENCAYVVGNWS